MESTSTSQRGKNAWVWALIGGVICIVIIAVVNAKNSEPLQSDTVPAIHTEDDDFTQLDISPEETEIETGTTSQDSEEIRQ